MTERKKCPNPVLPENVVVQGLYRLGIFSGPTSMYSAYCGPDTIPVTEDTGCDPSRCLSLWSPWSGQGTVGVQQ